VPATDSTIIHLSGTWCPTAILERVWAIIVNAVQRHSQLRLAHVGKEVLKLHPAFANRNASTPVIGEEAVVRIEAPLLHAVPNGMDASPAHSMRNIGLVHVPCTGGRAPFVFATAGKNFAIAQVTPANEFFRSAIAANRQKLPVIRDRDNRQQSKPSSRRHINSLDHNNTIIHIFKEGNSYAF
jgi:hypothetical protein